MTTGGDEYWTAAATQRLAFVDGFIDNISLPSHVPEARKAVADELAALDKATRSVGSRWNALTPICRLPQEVLAYIFHLHVTATGLSGSPERLYSNKLNKSDIRWVIGLTHVCRFWRQLALSLASLWSDVTFETGVEWGREMLARSQTAPVSLLLQELLPCDFFDARPSDTSPQRMTQKAALIPAHLHHTQSLEMWGCHCDIATVVASSSVSAPILEKFKVQIRSHDNEATDGDRPMMLNPDFLSENAPRLRDVHLEKCFLPWTSPLLNGLTRLEMSLEGHDLTLPLGSGSDLVHSLQTMPALESLKLSNCFPPDLTTYHTDSPIHLPLLTKLGISGTASECTALLKIIDAPSSTSLQIACTSTDGTGNNCCVVLPAFSAHLLRAQQAGATPKTLALIHRQPSLHIGLWDVVVADEPAWVPGAQGLRFDLKFTWAASPTALHMPTIEKVCSVIVRYMKSLRYVYVSSPAWQSEHWLALFANATEAVRVRGDESAGWSLSQAIAQTSSEPHPNPGDALGRLLFPKLRTMKLSQVDLTEPVEEADESFIPHLISRLNARASAGAAVKKLIISQCTVLRHMVRPLGEVVDVEYDYSQGELSEEDVDMDDDDE